MEKRCNVWLSLVREQLKSGLANEHGLELAEYVIAAALIGLAVIVAFTNLGSSVVGALEGLTGLLRSS